MKEKIIEIIIAIICGIFGLCGFWIVFINPLIQDQEHKEFIQFENELIQNRNSVIEQGCLNYSKMTELDVCKEKLGTGSLYSKKFNSCVDNDGTVSSYDLIKQSFEQDCYNRGVIKDAKENSKK